MLVFSPRERGCFHHDLFDPLAVEVFPAQAGVFLATMEFDPFVLIFPISVGSFFQH